MENVKSKIILIVLLIMAALLLFCLVPLWIHAKRSANKYNEHEVKMFGITMWGMLGAIIALAIEVITRTLL